jgi:starvation-inducible outer membrane lipoprotein|tara:strand:- start:400 stop:609 length:210 start_codon:yes stop_codon:yes gene_type:complete
MKKILALSFILTGCSAVQTTIESGKNIAGAVVDDVVSIGQTAIAIPVGAVGTVVDKLEEETQATDKETE